MGTEELSMDRWTGPAEIDAVSRRRARRRGRGSQAISTIAVTGRSVRDDLAAAGLMRGQGWQDGGSSHDEPAPPEFSEEQGYGVIQLPPDLFDADVLRLAQRIVLSVYAMEPPRTPLMRAVYRMLATLADQKIYPGWEGVTLGLLLGAAKVHGITIKTHPRYLAKEVGLRYAVLLKVRKAAIKELSQLSPSETGMGTYSSSGSGDPCD